MALPWLIGAAVVGLGAAIVKAVSDDDSSSSSSSTVDVGEERRRREAAALKQLEQEREKKRSNARVLFAEGGARLGDSLSEALDGVADVAETRSPSFVASLGANGYTLPPAEPMRAEEIKHALREAFPPKDAAITRIAGNLDFYTRAYDVRLQGNRKLYQKFARIEALDGKVTAWDEIEQQLLALKAGATPAA